MVRLPKNEITLISETFVISFFGNLDIPHVTSVQEIGFRISSNREVPWLHIVRMEKVSNKILNLLKKSRIELNTYLSQYDSSDI